jgi:hypothetical protein
VLYMRRGSLFLPCGLKLTTSYFKSTTNHTGPPTGDSCPAGRGPLPFPPLAMLSQVGSPVRPRLFVSPLRNTGPDPSPAQGDLAGSDCRTPCLPSLPSRRWATSGSPQSASICCPCPAGSVQLAAPFFGRGVVACLIIHDSTGEPRKEVRTFGTMTDDLLTLSDWL